MGSILSSKITKEQRSIILFLGLYVPDSIVGKVFSILDVPLEDTDPKELIIEYNLSRFFTQIDIDKFTHGNTISIGTCIQDSREMVVQKSKHDLIEYSINKYGVIQLNHIWINNTYREISIKRIPKLIYIYYYIDYIFGIDNGIYETYYNKLHTNSNELVSYQTYTRMILDMYMNKLDSTLEKIAYLISNGMDQDLIYCKHHDLTVEGIYEFLYNRALMLKLHYSKDNMTLLR